MRTILSLILLASMALAYTPNLSVCQVTDFGTPVKAAGFAWPTPQTTGEKMAFIGGQLAFAGTIGTITAVIADHNAKAQLRWYHWTPMVVACAGWGLWLASCTVK